MPASALLYWLALPPRNVPLLGAFAFTPILLAVREAPVVRAAAVGWLAHTATVFVCCAWLARTLVDFTSAGWPTASMFLLGFCVFEGGRWAAAIALLKACRAGRELEPLLFAAALVIVDGVYPQLLKWPLGIALLPNLPLLQPAAWLGPSVLSFIVGLTSGSLVLALDGIRRHRAWLLAYGAFLFSVALLGLERLLRPPEPTQARLSLGLVQGGAEPLLKRRDPEGVLRRYNALSRKALAEAPSLDLLVWSETAVAKPLEATRWRELLDLRLRGAFEVPLLVGASLSSFDGAGPVKAFNSALIFARDDVACGAACRYDKQQLVPMAEALPGGEKLRFAFPGAGRYSTAESTGPLELRGASLAVFICYESLDAELVRKLTQAAKPAQLLVNITNDGWFGRSAGAELHFALGRLRAIEQQRYLVRVAETGVTALVDPRGRVLQRLEPDEPGVLTTDAPLLSAITPFAQFGGWPLTLFSGLLLAAGLVQRTLTRRES